MSNRITRVVEDTSTGLIGGCSPPESWKGRYLLPSVFMSVCRSQKTTDLHGPGWRSEASGETVTFGVESILQREKLQTFTLEFQEEAC